MATVQLSEMEMFYQERGQGKATLLALHPSTVAGALFQWALPRNNGFRVLLPDQRGHGKTPNPAPDMHLYRLVDDMEELLEIKGVERLHGIGYSMGAAVLLGMARRNPGRFKSLAIIGATHRRPTPEQLTRLAGPLDQRKGIIREVTHPERGIRVGWEFSEQEAQKLTCPVALIAGDREQSNDVETYVELYRMLPNARLLVVPGANHFGFHNNAMVRQYLDDWYDMIAP